MVAAANMVEVAALVGDTARSTMLGALMTVTRRASTSLAKCSLAVVRDTCARNASSLPVNA